nr:60S ribosomal protein L28-1-like [Ipomoea batatas]GMD32333.1 60S ribosomal protein L28-1-like [Ipomoea batatas]
MAAVPGQLVWEIVKKNNSFLVKEFGNGTAGVVFSKEPNNLCNLHSYKHSGLANKKTVTIQGGKDQSVLLATTKTKKQNKPANLHNKSVMKKEFRRMAKAVTNQHKYDRKRRGLVAMYVTAGAARGQEMEDIGHKEEEGGVKRSSGGGGDFNRCFSLPIDPGGGVKSLKHMDSKKLKEEIKKWAKKVVAYARQVSDHFGSSRR